MSIYVSIVIPVYNEAGNIGLLLTDLISVLEDTVGKPYEVIVVNDGSKDGSEQEIEAAGAANPNIKLVSLSRNYGQTAAFMAGIDHASGEVIVTLDGDRQNDPADIPLLLEQIEQGYDVVSGWRQNRRDNMLLRTWPSRAANWLISLISGVKLQDYGCSLKAYRQGTIEGVRLYGEMHRFIPIYTHWQGGRLIEIPVNHHPRKLGRSKYGLMRAPKVILDLLVVVFMHKFLTRPIYIFGGFGIISISFSFVFFFLMLYFKFWGGKTFIETPLPMLTVTCFLLGVVSFLMGLQAEMLMRTYHESQAKPTYRVRNTLNLD